MYRDTQIYVLGSATKASKCYKVGHVVSRRASSPLFSFTTIRWLPFSGYVALIAENTLLRKENV